MKSSCFFSLLLVISCYDDLLVLKQRCLHFFKLGLKVGRIIKDQQFRTRFALFEIENEKKQNYPTDMPAYLIDP